MVAMGQSFTEMRAARLHGQWPGTHALKPPAGRAGSGRVACGEAEDIGLAVVRGGFRFDKRSMRRVRTTLIPESVGRFIGRDGLRLEAFQPINWPVLACQIVPAASRKRATA